MTQSTQPGESSRPAPWQLGRLAMGLLAVSVLSGVALVPLYDPAHALASVEALHAGIPWAWFLRGLHAYSSHALLVVTLAHGVEVLLVRSDAHVTAGVWWRSVLLFGVLVAAMLSGFVMRGDAEALSALRVWRGVFESVPLGGDVLARGFLGEGSGEMAVVALHHGGTLTLLCWLLAAEHAQKLWPDLRATVLGAVVGLTLAGLLPLGLGPPVGTAETGWLHGPWYLLGLQGALLSLPEALGWLGPLAFLVALGFVRHAGRRRAWALAVVAAFVVLYAGFTVRLLAVGAL